MLSINLVKILFTLVILREIIVIGLNKIAQKIKMLKNAAGTHNPSILTTAQKIPELDIKIDACFLSNPYATDLFFEYFTKELVQSHKLKEYLEFYPSQNRIVASVISKFTKINEKNIFVGNGAIEVIQAIMYDFVDKKIVINIPTFSSYYEFAKDKTEVIFYKLSKGNDYALDIEHYIDFIKKQKPDSVVIINPNNPDGNYINKDNLRYILKELSFVKNIIDESFIHFAHEDSQFSLVNIEALFAEIPNCIAIKSVSKDFGVAGIRAGYAIMNEEKINFLLKNGYLWNFCGFNEYFLIFTLKSPFFSKYEEIRKKYIKNTQNFFNSLTQIKSIKVYPSMANFCLVELLDGSLSSDFVVKMLINYGIYTRVCNDKIGLMGNL